MSVTYHYVDAPDYERQLAFDYLETYSFRRWPRYNPAETGRYLIDEDGRLHPSAVMTHRFQADHPFVIEIRKALSLPALNIPLWMCAPFYRDGMIFYDKEGNRLSVLNICLSCEYMETEPYHHIQADEKTYLLFRTLFTKLGHEIEES